MSTAKKDDIAKPNHVDVLISEIPYETYMEIRKQFMAKGYHVQGYQPGYYQTPNKKVEQE